MLLQMLVQFVGVAAAGVLVGVVSAVIGVTGAADSCRVLFAVGVSSVQLLFLLMSWSHYTPYSLLLVSMFCSFPCCWQCVCFFLWCSCCCFLVIFIRNLLVSCSFSVRFCPRRVCVLPSAAAGVLLLIVQRLLFCFWSLSLLYTPCLAPLVTVPRHAKD